MDEIICHSSTEEILKKAVQHTTEGLPEPKSRVEKLLCMLCEDICNLSQNGGSGGGGSVDLTNYVTKDYNATYSRLGLVKTSQLKGLGLSEGSLYIVRATPAQIESKTDEWCPITPKDVDYAVKVGVTTNQHSLSDAEKTAAQTWLGIPSQHYTKDEIDSMIGTAITQLSNI